MTCNKCGHPMDQGEAFCKNCGEPVAQSGAQPVQPLTQTGNQTGVNQPDGANNPAGGMPPQNPAGSGFAAGNPAEQSPASPANAEGPIPPSNPTPYGDGFNRVPGAGPAAPEMPPKKAAPKWIIFLVIGIIVVVGAIAAAVLINKAAVQKAVDAMESEIAAAEDLLTDVDGLFEKSDSDIIKSGLKADEISALQTKLDAIAVEPEGSHKEKVEDQLNMSAHRDRLEKMQGRLDEADEKLIAADEINGLFEVDAIGNEEDDVYYYPLNSGVDEAKIEELWGKYEDKDAMDGFWAIILDLLDSAEYELQCIDEAQEALAALDAKQSITSSEYESAVIDVDFLENGTIQDELRAKLESYKDRVVQEEEQSTPPVSPEEEAAVNNEGGYTLEQLIQDEPDLFDIETMNAGFGGMAEASVTAEGNVLLIKINYMEEWDSVLDLITNELDDQMDDVDSIYEMAAEMIRIEVPDAKVVLEICKSNGEAVWSRTY